ncbi:hypothetical protein Anas_01172 [Armadillidium nasatum]|uniref:Uncharacterized protein n=1 Tax=Armadillidium nasatum TaxID=96803 RepID=A0A5N5TNT6_9CRUS|nr:hypothetical protein Anas_01172 [Armadillidium nasatum]
MESQVSTAFSDLILVVSALWSYKKLSSVTEIDYQFSNWWFMLQMISASLGVLKFGRFGGRYHDKIEKYHKNFSWLTQTVGIPCLGAQFCFLYQFTTLSQIFLGSAVVSFVICSKKPELKESVPMFVTALVILILMFFALKESNTDLCYAVVLMIISTVIGTKDDFVILNLPATDIFHYLLAIANMFTVKALLYS